MSAEGRRTKRLLFHIGSLGGGGAERVLIQIIKKLNRNKYTPLLAVHKKGEYEPLVPDDVELITLPARGTLKKNINQISAINKIISAKKIDLAVSFLTNSNRALLRAKLFSNLEYKVIVTEHSNPYNITNNSDSFWNLLIPFEVRYLYPRADKILTVSHGIKKDFIQNWGINKDCKILTIHNPIDIDNIIVKAQENITLPWDDLRGYKIIIAVGRFTKEKGYIDLIKVFNTVSNKIKSKLIILGQGPLEEKIKHQIKTLGLSADVYMPGFVDNPWAYMRKSDLYLSTSHWEGFHLTIVESMACGTTPVATDCDYGPSEIIEDGVNGFLVPVGDISAISSKVLTLLHEDKVRSTFSKAAINRANDFALSSKILEYEKVFDQVLQS